MPQITTLSLGWGWQSWTIAAMCALRELPPIDMAIHADTGHEAEGTYAHAREWTPWLEERGVKVVTVHPDNKDITRFWNNGLPSVMVPAFTTNRRTGKHGQLKRQCTSYWKVRPIRSYLRELLGRGRPRSGAVEMWLGYTWDELHRMRYSDVKYIRNHYPLVDLRMTRQDCFAWLESYGLPVPPKSACVFCPYHSYDGWQRLRGDALETAAIADAMVRNKRRPVGYDLFIHPARIPLLQALDIDKDALELMEVPCDGGVCHV